jgi:DNA polymerase
MTREDMLRELELLPVWQLRNPLPAPTASQTLLNIPEPAIIEPEIEKLETLATQPLMHISSEDGDWLFVMGNQALQADEAQLFKNISKAIRMNAMPEQIVIDTLTTIQAKPPKIIIAMGELASQSLLQSTQPLTDLRGKLLKYHNICLIATYDLAHLLQHLPDKAKTWDDLRLAMHTMQDFKL